MLRPTLCSLALLAALSAAGCGDTRAAAGTGRVRLGVEELLEQHAELIAGKRVALITNPSGVDGDLVPTVDRLAADGRFELVRLFGPEHGIRGDTPAGDHVGDSRDPRTDVPVTSLYGSQRRPSAESLEGVDVLLFDVQDVGARCYTYVSTLGEAMHAAADAGVPLVVLDRPNPLGGQSFEGPVREEAWKSFIGWGPIPITHGMTAGEIALLYVDVLGIDCSLTVVPMHGWERSMVWEDTGLAWTQTSPHIPHALHAHLYVSTAMAASVTTNVSDGVGSTMPFEFLGADFVDAPALVAELERRELPGVRFQEAVVRPFYGRFESQSLRGVRLLLDDPKSFRPVRTALAFLVALRDLHADQLALAEVDVFAKHWGNERVREMLLAGSTLADIETSWEDELADFAATRRGVLIYD
jgi:beta-N-acetylhexosaminidase